VKKGMKMIIISIVILSLSGLVLINSFEPLEVDMIHLSLGSISMKIVEEGMVVPANEHLMYAKNGGLVKELQKKSGEKVQKGDVLCILKNDDLDFERDQLEARKKSLLGQKESAINAIKQQIIQLKDDEFLREGSGSLEKRLEILLEEYSRIKILYENAQATRLELDEIEWSIQQVREQLDVKQDRSALLKRQQSELGNVLSHFNSMIASVDSQILQLKKRKEDNVIVVPYQGILSDVHVQNNMILSPGTQIGRVIPQTAFHVEVYLLPEDVFYIEKGMKVEVIMERKDKDVELTGEVHRIDPVAIEKVSTLGLMEKRVKVTIALDSQETLRVGYSLDVHFEVLKRENVLSVPKTSIFQYEGVDMVWKVEEEKLKRQEVQKGMSTDVMVIVKDGLSENDTIVRNPYLEGLYEGLHVYEKR
jgi:HlyD family secretion protein